MTLRASAATLAVFAMFGFNPQALAATYTKTATAGPLNVAGSWSGGPPGALDIGLFNNMITGAQTDTLGGSFSIGELEFGTAGSSPGGLITIATDTSPYTLTLNGVLNSAGVNVGIDMSNDSSSVTFGGANDSLAIGAAQSWYVKSGDTLTVSGAISGSGNISIGSGSASTGGTVLLNTTADTFTGNYIVSNSDALSIQIGQSTTAAIVLNGGSTLTTNQALSTTNVVTIASGATTFTSTVGTNTTIIGNGNVTLTEPANSGLGGIAGFGGVETLGNSGPIREYIPATTIAPFATLNLNGGTNGAYIQPGNGSTLVLGGISSTAAAQNDIGNTVTVIAGSANTSTTWNGGSFGNLTFEKVGTGTLTLAPTKGVWTATTGSDFIHADGGILQVNYATTTTGTGIFTAGSTLSFDGGELYLLGNTTGASTQTMGAVTIGAGGGTLVDNPNGGTSTTLTLTTITATAAGGTLNIQPSGVSLGAGTAAITTTTGTLPDGTYGARITYGSDWATTASGASPYTLSAYTGYNFLASSYTGGTDTTNDQINGTTGNLTLASGYTTNSLKINNTSSQSLALGGNAVTLTNGGLLFAGSAPFTVGSAVDDGTIQSATATNSDLVIQDLGAGGLKINSVIANGAGASTLTIAGGGTVTLAGTNTYTGATYLNGGVTSISANSNLGLSSTGAAVYLNGGTLQTAGTFTLDNSGTNMRAVNIGGGGGTIDVTSANVLTVDGVISNNVANEYGPLTKTDSGTLILSGSNTYLGSTIISGGILSTALLANGGVASGIGASVNVGLALQLNGGTLQYTGAGASTDRTFDLTQNGGEIDSSGSGALNWTSTLPELYAGAGNRTLTLGGTNTGANTLTSPIGDATTTTGASGTVAITKAGSGSWTLAGLETYTGNTTVNQGVLNVAGSIAAASAVTVNGGTLNDTGIIGGSVTATGGAVNVAGSVGGSVNVTGAALGLSGSIAGAVAINAGATLTGAGNGTTSDVIGGALTVAGGTSSANSGAINLVNASSFPTLSAVSLTLGGTAGNASILDLGTGPSATDSILIGGTLTINAGGAAITITSQGTVANQTYNLLTFGGGTGAGFVIGSGTSVGGFTLTDPTLTFGVNGTLNVTSTNVQLVTTGAVTPSTAYWTGTAGSTWASTNASGGNFTTDLAGTSPIKAYPSTTTAVYFAAVGATNLTTDTLGQAFDIGSLTFLGTTVGAVTIGADGNQLTLESGGLTVQSGAGAVTLNPLIGLDAPQTWSNASIHNLTVNGVISGGTAAGLTVANTGAGLTIFSGSNTYAGGTTLSSGTLQLSGGGTLGSTSGALTINGGVLDLNGNNLGVGNLAGSGGVITSSTGSSPTFTFGNGGGTGGTFAGHITNANGVLLNITKTGAGTIALSGSNSYGGITGINGGVLQISAANNLGNSSATNTISFNGGTLESTANSYDLGVNRAIALPGAGTIQVDSGAALTVSGAISGIGNLTESGSGALTLTGSDGASGGFTVNGTLIVGPTGVINGPSGLNLSSGAILNIAGGTVNLPATGTSFIMGPQDSNSVAVYISGGSLTYGNNGVVDPGNNLRGSFTQTSGTVNTVESDMAPVGGDVFNLYIGGGSYISNQGEYGSFTVGTRGIANVYVDGTGSLTVNGATNPANTSNYQLIVGPQYGALGVANSVGARTFVQQGGTVTTNGLVLGAFAAAGAGSSGIYYLNGGTLNTSTLTRGSEGAGTTGTLVFGGGTLVTGAAFTTDANIVTQINSGGATISTTGGSLNWAGVIAAGSGGNVTGFTGLNGGSGYTTAPTVTISGGGGTGATAVAEINAAGQVIDVIITNPGSGFTSAPTFAFSAPASGSTASVTAGTIVTGNGGLTYNGPNTLTLAAANTYAGVTTLNGGILNINGVGAVGGASYGGMTFNGGTLQYVANIPGTNGSGDITQNSNGTQENVTIAAGGATIDTNGNGLVYLNSIGNSGSGSLTVESTTAGGSLTLLGNNTFTGGVTLSSGKLIFAGLNVYTGPTAINAGTLTLNSGGSLGNTAITVANGATFAVRGNTIGTTGASLTLAGGSILSLQDSTIDTVTLNGVGAGTGTVLMIGDSTAQGNLYFDFSNAGSDKLVVNDGETAFGADGGRIFLTDLTPSSAPLSTYTLISDPNGGLNTGTFQLSSSSLNISGTLYQLSLASSTPTAEILTFTAASPSNCYWTGTTSTSWSALSNFATDHTGSVAQTTPLNIASNVFLTADSPKAGNVASQTLDGNYSINSLNFTGAGTGAASIPITLSSGTGTALTLEAEAAYSDAAGNTHPIGTGLVVQPGSAAHTVAANVVLGSSQTWEIDNSAANGLTVSGAVSDGGYNYSLTKTGSGTLILSGADSYGGGTFVNAGTLALGAGGQLLATGTLAVEGTGTFDLAGNSQTINGLSDGGVATGVITSSTGSGMLTLNNSASNTFGGRITDSGNATNGVSLGLTLNGPGNVILSGSNSYNGLTVVASGTLNATNNYSLGNAASPVGGLQFTNAGSATVNFTSANPAIASLSTNGPLAGTSFVVLGNTVGTGSATTLNIGGNLGSAGQTTFFNGTISDQTAINAAAVGNLVVSGGSLVLENPDTFTGTTTISGSGTLLDIGSSTALQYSTLNDNDPNGTVSFGPLSAATLAGLTGSQSLALTGQGAIGSIALTIGGTNLPTTFTGNLGGLGSLTKVGTGTVQIGSGASGGASYAGATTINQATLIIGGTGYATGAIAVTGDLGVCALTVQDSAVINTTGTVILDGGGGNGFPYNATMTVSGSASVTSAGFAFGNGTARVNTGVSLTIQNSASVFDNGTFDFVNTDGGTSSQAVTTVNLNGGLLGVQKFILTNYGGNAASTASLQLNGGTVEALASDPGGSFFLPVLARLTADVDAGGAIFNTNGFNDTIAQTLVHGGGTPDGGVTKNGAGTLTLLGANSYTGITTLNAGTLNIDGEYALGGSVYGGLTFNGGTLQYALAFSGSNNGTGDITQNSNNVAKTVTVAAGGATIDTDGNAVTYANPLGGGGPGNVTLIDSLGTGSLTLEAAASYTGLTTINHGATLQLGTGVAGQDGTILTTSGITDNGSLIYNRSGALSTSVAISGTGSVTMTGTGTQTLAGIESYTGATAVNQGRLIVSGSLTGTTSVMVSGTAHLEVDGLVDNSTTVHVNSGAFLNGTGTVGPVNIASNGILGPGRTLNGTTAGTLTANGNVVLTDSTSQFSVRLGVVTPGDNDELAVTPGDSVTLNGATLKLTLGGNFNARALASNYIFVLINAGASPANKISGQFAQGSSITDSNGDIYSILYNVNATNTGGGSDVDLELTTAVPEPGTWATLLSGAAMLACWRRSRRRGTGSHGQ